MNSEGFADTRMQRGEEASIFKIEFVVNVFIQPLAHTMEL